MMVWLFHKRLTKHRSTKLRLLMRFHKRANVTAYFHYFTEAEADEGIIEIFADFGQSGIGDHLMDMSMARKVWTDKSKQFDSMGVWLPIRKCMLQLRLKTRVTEHTHGIH